MRITIFALALTLAASFSITGCASITDGNDTRTRATLGGTALGGVAGLVIGSGTGAVVAGSAVGATGGYILGSSVDAENTDM